MKRLFVTLLIITLMVSFTGCDNNKEKDKLYYSVENNNLQGLKEVIADSPDLKFDKLNHREFTEFRKNDRRALSVAFDGGYTDETVITCMLDTGRVNTDNDDSLKYLTDAICRDYSLELAKKLIENGADVNAGEHQALTQLLSSMDTNIAKNEERINFLISKGAVIDEHMLDAVLENPYKYIYTPKIIAMLRKYDVEPDNSMRTLIAAATGDENEILAVASAGKEKLTEEELIFAAGSCSKETLRKLTEYGYDLKIRDEDGWTPLHAAAFNNSRDVVEYLIDEGIDVNADADFYEVTPFDMAVIGENYDIIQYFMEHEARTENAWQYACLNETDETVRFMMEHGYKMEKSDYYWAYVESSNSVFDFAIKNNFPINIIYDDGIPVEEVNREDRIIALVEHGAKITKNTLAHAVELRAYGAVDIILEKDKNVDMGEALIGAVEIGDYEIVMKLVENGADVNRLVDTEDGRYTALHVASWSTSADILKYLIEEGGDLRIKDSNGKTSYEYAKQSGTKENMGIIKKSTERIIKPLKY